MGGYTVILTDSEYDALKARIARLEAALAWTWDHSKLLESAIPVPNWVLDVQRSQPARTDLRI
jgi:hypothetical protein